MSDEGNGPRGDTDGDGEDDPFDALDDLADVDAPAVVDDPADVDDLFAELGAGVDADIDADASGSDDSGAAGPDDSDSDSFGPADFDAASAAVGDAPDSGDSDPFDELGPADSGDLDDAFERMDVGGAAEEDVWESLDADAGVAGAAAAAGEAMSAPGETDTEHVVPKRTYCQQCPHFTPPPEVACTHEGTSIVEAVGFDEFRVRNCPMISEEDPTFDADG